MHAFYSDQFVLPLPPGHRFPMAKYRMLRDQLAQQLPDVQLQLAPSATDGELALAHTPEYIASIVHGTASAAAMREIGFPWSPAMVERARRSVGATIAAARSALFNAAANGVGNSDSSGDTPAGVAANLAGGTHHAYADNGGGFCVFNDVAVAARLMQAEWGRKHGAHTTHPRPALQVAVIDLDVHQGNGTTSIFKDDDSVFTLSVHGDKNFPFRKESSRLDVPLPDGCGDAQYLAALEHALQELDDRFAQGLVLYLAGADPYEGDRLGRLKLSFDGLESRDRRVFDWCFTRRVPVAFQMAGRWLRPPH